MFPICLVSAPLSLQTISSHLSSFTCAAVGETVTWFKEVVKLVIVSETYVVFYDQVVTLMHSFLSGGPGCCALFSFYLLTFPAWVTLPEATLPPSKLSRSQKHRNLFYMTRWQSQRGVNLNKHNKNLWQFIFLRVSETNLTWN